MAVVLVSTIVLKMNFTMPQVNGSVASNTMCYSMVCYRLWQVLLQLCDTRNLAEA